MACIRKFVTADTHFGHPAIIKYCNRPFQNVEQMDRKLIKNWNATVNHSDIVYHLGDFALGPKQYKQKILEQLNGTIILIRGNHDKTVAHCKSLGFHEVHDSLIVGNVLMRHVGFKYIPTINVSVENWDYRPIPLPTPRNFLHLCGHSHDAFIIRCGETGDI